MMAATIPISSPKPICSFNTWSIRKKNPSITTRVNIPYKISVNIASEVLCFD